MEPNIHQIKKNNLDGFNVEVFYNILLSDGSFTVQVIKKLLFQLTRFKLRSAFTLVAMQDCQ